MAAKKHSKLKSYLNSNYIEFADEQTSLRLNSLYSDFSKIHAVNQYAYDANIGFWKTIILDCNEQGYLRTSEYATAIDKATIASEFHRPLKGKPLALTCVLVSRSRSLELFEVIINFLHFRNIWKRRMT